MAKQGKNKLIDKCDALYVWHKDAIFRMAYAAVGADKEWALKLLEDCMIETCANIDRFGAENSDDSKSKMTAILQRMINKIYLEAWRKIGLGDEHKGISISQKDRFDVDQVLIRNNYTAELARYVEKLTNADKEFIFMRFYMGYTADELSKQYGCSPEEIDKRTFLVKQKIAKMIMGR